MPRDFSKAFDMYTWAPSSLFFFYLSDRKVARIAKRCLTTFKPCTWIVTGCFKYLGSSKHNWSKEFLKFEQTKQFNLGSFEFLEARNHTIALASRNVLVKTWWRLLKHFEPCFFILKFQIRNSNTLHNKGVWKGFKAFLMKEVTGNHLQKVLEASHCTIACL